MNSRLFLIVVFLLSGLACSEDPDTAAVINVKLPGRTVQPPEDLAFSVKVTDMDGIQSIQVIFKRDRFDNSLSAFNKTYEPQGTAFTISEKIPLPIEFISGLYTLVVEVTDSRGRKNMAEDEIWVKEYITIEVKRPKSSEALTTPYILPVDLVVKSNTPLRYITLRFIHLGSMVLFKNYLQPMHPETFFSEIKEQMPFELLLTEDASGTMHIEASVFQFSQEKTVNVLIRK